MHNTHQIMTVCDSSKDLNILCWKADVKLKLLPSFLRILCVNSHWFPAIIAAGNHSLFVSELSFASWLCRLKFLFKTTRFFLGDEGSSSSSLSSSLSLSLSASCSLIPPFINGSSLGASGYTLKSCLSLLKISN